MLCLDCPTLCCVLADSVLAWPDIRCDSNYGDGNVVVILLVFWCKPGARVSDALKIYSSIWKPQIQLSMALGWLIMKIPIHISSTCHKQNVNIRAEKSERGRWREIEQRNIRKKRKFGVHESLPMWLATLKLAEGLFWLLDRNLTHLLVNGWWISNVWQQALQFVSNQYCLHFVYYECSGYDLLH